MRYAITFTIETTEADAGVVLEAAEQALPDLLLCLEAPATNVDDGTSPSVVEAPCPAQHERMLAKMRRDPASALSKRDALPKCSNASCSNTVEYRDDGLCPWCFEVRA